MAFNICVILQIRHFLGTFQGKQWQKDYLTGKANVSDTKKMMDCMDYIQKWKDLGMFTANKKESTE